MEQRNVSGGLDDKEAEKKIQESADNIEVRDYSLIWNNIKDRVQPEKRKKRRRLLPIAVSAACAAVGCAVAVPIAVRYLSPEPETVYFYDELVTETMPLDELCEELTAAGMEYADFSGYEVMGSMLFKTGDFKVKGGLVELTDDSENPTFFLSLRLYDEDVIVRFVPEIVYDSRYVANGTEVEYTIQEATSDGVYVYNIRANYRGADYYMEYTCFTEDITPFLDAFFS